MNRFFKHLSIAVIVIGVFAAGLWGNAAEADKTFQDRYNQAKRLIYKKDWSKAVDAFEQLLGHSKHQQYKDRLLYWLAYSQNAYTKSLDERDNQVRFLENALDRLNDLFEDFPGSKWVDDGKILRIEIAEKLVKLGLNGYQKVIEKSSREKNNEDLKIYALDSLLNMDRKNAMPLLEKMIQDPSSSLRILKKAVFIISQQNSPKVIAILKQIALDAKRPYTLRKDAIFWLGQADGDQVTDILLSLYSSVEEKKLKEKIVFSLSQKGDKGIETMISLYKKESDLKIKKKILFWMGQSNSQKAREFIKKILLERPAS